MLKKSKYTMATSIPSSIEVRDLDTALKHLVDWEIFAVHLRGMKKRDIDLIKRNHRGDAEQQKLELYGKWLEVCPDASWGDVVKALKDCQNNALAEKVSNKYLSETVTGFRNKLPKGIRKPTRAMEDSDSEQEGSRYQDEEEEFRQRKPKVTRETNQVVQNASIEQLRIESEERIKELELQASIEKTRIESAERIKELELQASIEKTRIEAEEKRKELELQASIEKIKIHSVERR